MTMTEAELFEDLDESNHTIVRRWLDRGDGVAVYENHDLGDPNCGARQFVSFGSKAAKLEVAEPPARLPMVGSATDWSYRLIATVRRAAKPEEEAARE